MRFLAILPLAFLFSFGIADAAINRTLAFGARGTDVVELQNFLIAQNLLAPDSATGYFGRLTQAAVQGFQTSRGIVTSGTPESTGFGVVGPRTRAAMHQEESAVLGTSTYSPFIGGNTSIVSYAWVPSPWGACVNGTQYRTASCMGSNGFVYPAQLCPGLMPATTQKCDINVPQSCTFNGRSIPHASSTIAYQASSVPAGSSCVSQTRTCTNGVLSGTYQYSACTVTPVVAPRSCNFNGTMIPHASSTTAYQSPLVPVGQSCISEQRVCTNGTLSGTYTHSTCTVSSPAKPTVINGPVKRSDVFLSPRGNTAGWESALTAFKANRITWTYAPHIFIPKVTPENIPVQCAIPFWVPSTHARAKEMECLDINGKGITPGFDPNIKAVFQDINSDAWREYILASTKNLVDLGCTSFQQDDPRQNLVHVRAAGTGPGCYSNDSLAKFRTYLKTNLTPAQLSALGVTNVDTFDYRVNNLPALRPHWAAFHTKAVQEYYQWLFPQIESYVKTKYPAVDDVRFSGNFGHMPDEPTSKAPVPSFDFFQGELYGTKEESLARIRTAATKSFFPNTTGIFTIASTSVWLNARSIASSYALGITTIVPWDVYIPYGNPRFFGNPADFEKIYSVVRNNQKVFDDYVNDSDAYGTYSKAHPGQGYITAVDRTTDPQSTILSWSRTESFPTVSASTSVRIRGVAHLTKRTSTEGKLILPAGIAANIGDPVYLYLAPAELVTIRSNISNPQKKAVHLVSWRDPSATSPTGTVVLSLHLEKKAFPFPPNRIITSLTTTATPITPIDMGEYYIYPLSNVMWGVLFHE